MSDEVTTMDGGQVQAIANLPPNLMLLKMENDSIMAVARATPRDPMKIVKQLQELIDAFPAAADEAIYSKPVGTAVEVTCGACGIKYEVNKVDKDTACPGCEAPAICRGKGAATTRKIKKFAEGLSIRAAESIRSIYGYTRLATTTEQLPDDRVKLTGVLVDYAAGNVTSDERILSPWYRARGGGMTKTPEDRFLGVVVKAEKAKLRRDVILDNTPNIVKAMFRDACERKMLDLVKPEVIEQKILPAFAEYGITADQLDLIVGRPKALGWRERQRLELRKILNALKNGETTPRELLDGLSEKPGGPSVPASGATMDDLTNPKEPTDAPPSSIDTGTPDPETPAEPAPEPEPQDSAPEPSVLNEWKPIVDSCGSAADVKQARKYLEEDTTLSAEQKTEVVKWLDAAAKKYGGRGKA